MKVPFTGNAFMLKLSPSNNDKTPSLQPKVTTSSPPIMVSSPVSLPTSSVSPTNGFTTTSPSAAIVPTATETGTDTKKKKRSSSCIMISTISNTATNTIRRGRRATMTTTTALSGIQLLTIEILLPDELITHILTYLHTDIKTLSAIAEISPRLHRITMNVIRSYFLPNIQLSTVIDQEGRRKSTMQYVFDTLDNDTLEIQFRPITVSPQRYRNDNFAASPTLHRLSINDINNYSSLESLSTLSWPFPTTHSLSSSDNEEDENNNNNNNDDDNNNGSRRQTSWHTLDSITSIHNIKNTDKNFNNKNNIKKTTEITSGKRKQLLQITKPGTFLSSSTNGSLWQLEYLVSTDHHSAFMSANIAAAIMNNTNKYNHLSMGENDSGYNERFVTPLFIKTHLSLFLDDGKQQTKNNHLRKRNSLLLWFNKIKK
ncbi:hypothetical protein BDC45DRAFT_497007 [Circinella umbellata]|nr:hypothetical protein BDC45DRAFT_497007 [Circinella umbellata]